MTTVKSEKWDKQKANRRHRHAGKNTLNREPTPGIFPDKKETSSPWSMAKDGKQYLKRASKKDLRK